MATYGNSANGIEGPSKIHILNVNLFTTVSATKVNEFHVTYSREDRPRSAVTSNVPADTGIGFGPSFRFGNPFFLAPNVDELIKRFQVKNNFTIITGAHTIKTGAEWLHTNNYQVFRGFFEGRYLFDSVTGFLRYASPAAPGGFGPYTVGCSNGTLCHGAGVLPGRHDDDVAGRCCSTCRAAALTASPATRPASRTSTTRSSRSSSRTSGRSRRGVTLDYGLRWDAQLMPKTVDPKTTAYATVPERPAVPVGRHDPRPVEAVPAAPRGGLGRQGRRQDGGPRERGHLLRPAEHAEPGRIGHDQRHPAEDRLPRRHLHLVRRHARLAEPAGAERRAAGHVPALHRRPRVRPRLQEPAHLQLQRRVRAAAGARLGGLRRLHATRRVST